MAYTKCQYKGRCAIMSNEYSRTMAHLETMIQEALRDFPGLPRDEIEFVIYGGTSRKRTTGIEFCPEGDIPDTYYNEPNGLELRL
jgi:hypothetical protein